MGAGGYDALLLVRCNVDMEPLLSGRELLRSGGLVLYWWRRIGTGGGARGIRRAAATADSCCPGGPAQHTVLRNHIK